MGKWNYRRTWRPKNYYRDQRIPSPPTYYDTEFKLRGAWKNADLPWEERFCISVGIPWQKVVNAKKYMHCYDNVVQWNDSAGEITFCEAKKRFWEIINGIPTDDPQPDPDMYNDEIDWDPKIDLQLVKDLDIAYFNPDEAEKAELSYAAKKNSDDLVPGCILGLDRKDVSNSNNPWGRDKNTNVNKNISDPWERGITQDDREIKENAWGGGGSSSWHKDVTWGGGVNNSWHWSQYMQKEDNFSKNTYGWGSNRNSGAYVCTSRGTEPRQAPNRQRGNYQDASFGRGRWHDQHDRQRHNGNGWESSVGCRKRQGSQQYTSSYKSARVQNDDYREGNQYRR